MSEEFDLEKTITRLLTPQKTLAPWIFDENGKMLLDVQKKLLKIVNNIIKMLVGDMESVEIVDVYLTGSSSRYMWKEDSDVDMQVVLHNAGCPDLINDDKAIHKFFSLLREGLYGEKYAAYFLGRPVDIKFSPKKIEFLSLYSIKNNKWLIEPTRDYAKSLTVQEMTEYYLNKKEEFLKELEKIKSENEGLELGKQLSQLYSKIYEKYNEALNIKDFLVFKLLHYEGLVKPLGQENIQLQNEEYCLKLNRKKGLRLKEVRSI